MKQVQNNKKCLQRLKDKVKSLMKSMEDHIDSVRDQHEQQDRMNTLLH